MKSIYYQILKVMSEFYPTWVTYLNRNRARKKLVLMHYRQVISEEWSADVAKQLEAWLKGSKNIHFKKFPPGAPQLKDILEILIKKKENAVRIPEVPRAYDPDLSLHRLAALWFMGHENIFNEKNEHLKPATLQIADCLKNNPSLYQFAMRFAELFIRLRKIYSAQSSFQKLLAPENRKTLLSKIGSVDVEVLMHFLAETRWHREISEILDKKYRKIV